MIEWQGECCERDARASTLSGELYKSYCAWCDRNGARVKSNKELSSALVEAGFEKKPTMGGKLFYGLKLKAP